MCPTSTKALLEVVNDLFEEQTDLEKIVRKIMQRALTLLQCERCSVLLLEDIHSPVRPDSQNTPVRPDSQNTPVRPDSQNTPVRPDTQNTPL